jgi:hypothetical protein
MMALSGHGYTRLAQDSAHAAGNQQAAILYCGIGGLRGWHGGPPREIILIKFSMVAIWPRLF